MVAARCPARRARPRWPVQAVRVRWHPTPVRQPVLTVGYRPAVGWPAVRHRTAIRDPPVRSSVRRGAFGRGAMRHPRAARRRAGGRRAAPARGACRHLGTRRAARRGPEVHPAPHRRGRRYRACRYRACRRGQGRRSAQRRLRGRRPGGQRPGGQRPGGQRPGETGLAGPGAGVRAGGAVAAGAASRPGGAAIARNRLPRRLPVGLTRPHRPPRRRLGSRHRTDRVQGHSHGDPARAWGYRTRHGRGRCRHVPPDTSWTLVSSRAAGHLSLPLECRSPEIPCMT